MKMWWINLPKNFPPHTLTEQLNVSHWQTRLCRQINSSSDMFPVCRGSMLSINSIPRCLVNKVWTSPYFVLFCLPVFSVFVQFISGIVSGFGLGWGSVSQATRHAVTINNEPLPKCVQLFSFVCICVSFSICVRTNEGPSTSEKEDIFCK